MVVSGLLGGVSVLALPKIIPGIKVKDYRGALKLVGAIVVLRLILDLVFGWVLRVTHILTLGLSFLVVNALVLKGADTFVEEVEVDGLDSAFLGSLVLSILWTILNWIIL
jgi:uncharacterized membrane protein YvlD (DUF360 family)